MLTASSLGSAPLIFSRLGRCGQTQGSQVGLTAHLSSQSAPCPPASETQGALCPIAPLNTAPKLHTVLEETSLGRKWLTPLLGTATALAAPTTH